ncbi:MAG TPA: hypothetical protein VMI33_09215 [Streptosporangiaceae bacterium]|nr:hypothetical protein [Streptosporangiaceae bacterium]
MTSVADIQADIDALRELADALTRFRHAQREVVERGDHEIEITRASLEAKASRWRSLLARRLAELAACQQAAAQEAAGGLAGCSAEAAAVAEAQDHLDHIRRWQQRVEEQAGAFRGVASRFRDLLDLDLPRTETHLRAIVGGLEASRRIQVAGS